MFIIPCSLSHVHYATFIMPCSLSHVHYDMFIMPCSLCHVYYAMVIMPCSLYHVHYAMVIIPCSLCHVYYATKGLHVKVSNSWMYAKLSTQFPLLSVKFNNISIMSLLEAWARTMDKRWWISPPGGAIKWNTILEYYQIKKLWTDFQIRLPQNLN